MARYFCFSCGATTRIAPGLAVAICPACEARHRPDTGAQFTLIGADGRSVGPLPRERVVEQLQKGLLGRRDRVAEIGGVAVRIERHPDFAPYFLPGDPHHESLASALAARETTRQRRAAMRRRRALLFVAVLATSVAVPLVAWKTRLTIVPQSTMDRVVGAGRKALDYAVLQFREAFDKDAAVEKVRASLQAPGEDVVSSVKALWPAAGNLPAGAVPAGAIDDAWTALAEGTSDGLDRARKGAEQALAADPEGPGAAAVLAVVYARLSKAEPDLSRRSVVLIERARFFDAESRDVLRAQPGIAVANRAWRQAISSAGKCLDTLPDDGICRWYLGEGQMGLHDFESACGTLKQAGEMMPGAPAIELALGRSALETLDYAMAERALARFAGRFPDDKGVQALLARLYRETGELDRAIEHARPAAEGGSMEYGARLLLGELLLQERGDVQGADTVLEALASEDHRVFEGRDEALVQASHAARAAGHLDAARRFALDALDTNGGWAPGRLALALALEASGDDAGAEDSWKAADASSVEGREAARFHYRYALFLSAHDRQRLASAELASAAEADPDWFPAQLALAITGLRMGSPRHAVQVISDTFKLDIQQEIARDPIVLSWYPLPDPDAALKQLRDGIKADARMQVYLPRVQGIVLGWRCVTSGESCGPARRMLEAALQVNDGDIPAHAWLARLDMKDGRNEEAISRLTRVAASAADSAALDALRGKALANAGRAEESENAFRQAYGKAPRSPGVHRRHAEALIAEGRPDEAVEHLRAAISHDPLDQASRRLLLALGRKSE